MANKIQIDTVKHLYELADNIQGEWKLTTEDTQMARRTKGAEYCQKLINKYQDYYKSKKESLDLLADAEILLEFILEQAISRPDILIDLAVKLEFASQWSNFPERFFQDIRRI